MRTFLSNLMNSMADSAGWTEETLSFCRLTLWMFVNVLMNNWVKGGQPPNLDQPQWNNLLDVLFIVKEFIFYRPVSSDFLSPNGKEKPCGIHLDARGCLDLPLVGRIVEFLAGLIHKVEPQVTETSPKEEKEIVLKLTEETKFFIFLYSAFNPTKSGGSKDDEESVLVWNNHKEKLEHVLNIVRKKNTLIPPRRS